MKQITGERPIRRAGLKKAGGAVDAGGVDPISSNAANLELIGAAVARDRKDAKALGDAMVKLIETSAATGRENLPPDATFHTYA
jgi:hypothetical protein